MNGETVTRATNDSAGSSTIALEYIIAKQDGKSSGPIQPGEEVPPRFNDPTSKEELDELTYWAGRGLLLAQKVLYLKHLSFRQELKARRLIPWWARDFKQGMQHSPPQWMRERQEIYKREKMELKLRRCDDPVSSGPKAQLGPWSPITEWAEDALDQRDTHYEYNPVLRIVEERVYLPFLRAGLLAQFTRPRHIVNIPLAWGSTDTREWWLYHLLAIMGTRDGYRDYRNVTGTQIAPVRNLQPYDQASYGATQRSDIARHLAEGGVTDEDMSDSFE